VVLFPAEEINNNNNKKKTKKNYLAGGAFGLFVAFGESRIEIDKRSFSISRYISQILSTQICDADVTRLPHLCRH
jgi:hypothetical protein